MCRNSGKPYYKKKYHVDKRKAEMINSLISEKFTPDSDGVIADPNGSYTGIAYPKYEKPVQDVDDL